MNQRAHRERHQPESRQNLGILEKKKDYKLRANDRAEKEETLKLLRKRALNKNPDEFYHHMINSKIEDDEHFEKDKDEEELTPEQKKLMETQDKKYIAMKRTIEANKIKRLQAHLHMTDVADRTKNKHIFFVDNEQEMKNFDLAKRLNTHPALLNRKSNRLRIDQLEKMNLDLDEVTLKKMNEERQNAYKELEKRIKRERDLGKVQRKLELKNVSNRQRKTLKPKEFRQMTKSPHNPIFKFKFERKK